MRIHSLLILFLLLTACIGKNDISIENKETTTDITGVVTEIVERDYWEGCETGKGECLPLTFIRKKSYKKWFLKVPCGGSFTDVTLSNHKKIIQKINISSIDCPPVFELTNLEDGKYYAYMLACGLGGGIEINLKTLE